MAEWMRNNWWLAVVAVGVLVASRVAPFRSHFWLSLLAAATIGLAVGAIEVAIRKRSKGSSRHQNEIQL
jgi:hypothetical protein